MRRRNRQWNFYQHENLHQESGNAASEHAEHQAQRGGQVSLCMTLHRRFVRINMDCGVDGFEIMMPHQAGAAITVSALTTPDS